MSYDIKKIEELLTNDSFLKYCKGDINERYAWDKRLKDDPSLVKTFDQATRLFHLIGAELTDVPAEAERFRTLLNNLQDANTPSVGKSIVAKVWTWTIAASIILVLSASIYFLKTDNIKQEVVSNKSQHVPIANDVQPGGSRAILTLGDGSVITLDSADNGTLSRQGNMNVIKQKDGQLSYNKTGNTPSENLYNTVSTPRGGEYKIVLSDGTSVWLNAASSIRYPATFQGNERNVSISGEAYFEVAKNPAAPFKVEVKGITIEVLGTHFNINSYDDEPTLNTTLLEGAISLKKGATSKLMKPGQQVQLSKTGEMKLVDDANVDEAMAWRNGIFQFKNANLAMVLRQLVRWYDVEVEFQGNAPLLNFGGEVSRDNNLSQVLQILNYSGVKFVIDGKKLIVKP